MLSSLHDFIALLERHNELQQVEVEVSTQLELAAITRRVSTMPHGGTALLFRHPGAFSFPVVTNLFGSRRRMRLALGLDHLHDLTAFCNRMLDGVPLQGVARLGALLAAHPDLACCRPVTVASGPCNETVVPGADLLQLPFLQNWPDDGSAAGTGRYITLGQVITTAPDGADNNCGIYRCQIHDAHTLAIRWRGGSGAEQHYRQYARQGKAMPLAVVLGGPPALTLTAAWPLPEGLCELAVAGWLRGASIPMLQCSHGPLQVPAEAELVIEGFVEPDSTIIEGPFGNHTGRYDPAGQAARMRVTRITRRQAPVVPATVVGPPPQEDCWMMLGWERLLAALLPRLVPGVVEIRMPLPWVFRQSAIISVEHSSPSAVRETVQALWQLSWFRKARLLILVDAAVAPDDLLQVAWHLVHEADWLDDLIRDEAGGRLAVDATRRFAGEQLSDPASLALIERRWADYGLA